MKIEIDYNGAFAECRIEPMEELGKMVNFNEADTKSQTYALSAFQTIKEHFWGMESNAFYGIHYDDTADILYDIHQVIRHQLWLDRPDSEKSHITVDASEAMQIGDEPLAIIEREEV